MGECFHLDDVEKTGAAYYADPPEYEWRCHACGATWMATESDEADRVDDIENAATHAGTILGEDDDDGG